ncbi:UBX domain-containing protein 6 [Procambarus clarkii]|uniref:UBX domain-containing protein 6 n=1 Tax=Procambarus clarkii TaxID=6728 RepID=UPI001E6763AF|nr:UBX domain-containing protein 6-like [Procambarus clarkii]XP_045584961.1 UBX domain-containing protein 6-like [Procambarus clarkii]XP_045584962.1 UBX domain-containing protein 6-like [Procambarus clarkii]XP_045584963.1 UBX domain-containing protein 6-like [Procambarus clarkii]XP_045584965.1 UBX domain-containing protein 6-like [Procambarus clarkii]
MDAIKKFFEKKKADAKFKTSGQGHSLSGGGQQRHVPSRSAHSVPHERHVPTNDAQRAGAAALARMEQQTKKTDVNWSLQAIKAQARRELEAEQKALEQMNLSEQDQPPIPKEVNLDAAPMLAVQGVFFSCPLIGPEVATYDEIKRQIREFLYAQVEDDKGISSCLIIHTCNKNKEKVNVCIETLCKYVENIVSNPTEEKFHKIRMSNKAYQERILPVEGTREFLEAAGFVEQELPFNDSTDMFWVFPEEKLNDLVTLEQLRDALVSAEPVRPQLDRSLTILLPAEAATHVDLPAEFFNMTADELKREMQNRAMAVERSQMLLTKAMRERQELREMRKYRFSLIRVRFPDGIILQGTFGVHEKFEEVLKFIRENLVNDWRPFFLSLSGGGKVVETEQSLVELRLVPAVVLNFKWDPSIEDPNLDDSVFLKSDTLMLLQS